MALEDLARRAESESAQPGTGTRILEWPQEMILPLNPEKASQDFSGITIGRPLPAVVRDLLAGSGLDWYGMSVVVDENAVDPFFRKIAAHLPNNELVLGGGSDLVQLVMGLPKQIWGNFESVNAVMPLRLFQEDPEKTFLMIDHVSVPPFGERLEERGLEISVNGESTTNLKLMIQNTLDGRDLGQSPNEFLMVPVKHGYLAVVPEDGPVILYFRTSNDLEAFKQKLLTLPDAEHIDADSWIKRIPVEDRFQIILNTLQYCAIVYERGSDNGWCFDPFSHAFLREIAGRLSVRQMQEVKGFVGEVFRNSGIEPKHLEDTFEYLGLTRPGGRDFSSEYEAA